MSEIVWVGYSDVAPRMFCVCKSQDIGEQSIRKFAEYGYNELEEDSRIDGLVVFRAYYTDKQTHEKTLICRFYLERMQVYE